MRFFRVTIHAQNSSRSCSLRLPVFSLKGWKFAQNIVKLGLVLLFIQVGVLFSYDHLVGKALEQRRILQTSLKKEQNRLNGLNARMDTLFQDQALLHQQFGLAYENHFPMEMGTGGTVDPELRLQWSATPLLEYASSLNDKVDMLRLEIEHNRETFSDLNSYMHQQYTNWKHIPSISPTTGRFTSPFGPRIHPVTGEVGKMHYGIDIANGRWTPIYAPADGLVETARLSDSFGHFLVINHGSGFVTKYGHLQAFAVRQGQFVKRYQLIGYMGNSGLSSGTHLHYEVWCNNQAINPLRNILPDDYAIE